MKPHEFKALLDRYSRGEATPQEEKLIHDWYRDIGRSEDYSETDQEWDIVKRSSLESRLWSKIRPLSSINQPNSPAKQGHTWYLTRIAASFLFLALVLSGLFYLSNRVGFATDETTSQSVITTTDGSQIHIVNNKKLEQEIVLDDGSVVLLKPLSELRFDKKFPAGKREVHLAGEAFFKVSRDPLRPFMVYSNEVVTKVLGTSFNIKAYKNDEEVTVAVKTGKVSVYTTTGEQISETSGNDAVILTPNQQIVYNRQKELVSKQLVENPEIILDKPTLFNMRYDGTPVTRIFEVLEENYGVHIEFDEKTLSGCVLTTSMSDEGLYERIQVICKAINAEYTITDAVITIQSRGCL
jgi:transmembrane sensor